MRTDVVVLAAGRGARLGRHGTETPKWLLEVGGRTIADRQLDALDEANRQAPGRIASIRVVTGHAANEIDRFLRGRSGLEVGTLFNPEYERLNNWYSVLLALREREADTDAVAIINSDLFAGSQWLSAFFADAITTERESLIGVDLARTLTDESMKVAASNQSEQGSSLTAIGKIDVVDPVGEYVGVLMARGEVLGRMQETLESFVGRPEMANEWYERAVGDTAARGSHWWIWPTPSSRWVEIDDGADYEAAIAMADGI